MYFVMDTTAGEKERKTLEALLTMPATRTEIVIGKFLIAVLIAMLGVINTILMSVFERLQEIGIIKSIGAMPWDVFKLIWVETILLCLLGGALGIAFSLGLSKLTEILIRRTDDYWRLWVNKETPPLESLPEPVSQLYRRSLLILNTQIDWQGGITAANDSDIQQFANAADNITDSILNLARIAGLLKIKKETSGTQTSRRNN
jgi:hypothetical protein